MRGIPFPRVVLSTFSSHIRASMVASGRYIATFPRSLANYFSGPFGMRVLNVELPHRPWPAALLTLKNRTLSPVAGVFLDHLRKFAWANYPLTAQQQSKARRRGT